MTDVNDIREDAGRELEAGDSRRRFCQIAIGSTAVVSAGVASYPLVAFLQLPKSLGPLELLEVPLDELQDGQGYWGTHRGRQIVVIRMGDEIRAFHGECTHLGCIVRWDSAKRIFKCPCHEGTYDELGNPIGGPVNAPLRRVNFVVDDGVLKIRDVAASA